MKGRKYIFYTFLLTSFIYCGIKAYAQTSEQIFPKDTITAKSLEDTTLINAVYNKFVFAIDSDGNENPADYFTNRALKKLQDDYEFDCDDEPCYAYYALRTMQQDSNPDSDGRSEICSIEPTDNGWYTVSYYDMGWPGKTRIKVVDGKIDMYERLE